MVIPCSRSPARRSPSPRRSLSPQKSISPQRSTTPRKSPGGGSPENRSRDGRSLTPHSVSPRGRPEASRSPSPRNSNGDVSNVHLELCSENIAKFIVNKVFSSTYCDFSILFSFAGVSIVFMKNSGDTWISVPVDVLLMSHLLFNVNGLISH